MEPTVEAPKIGMPQASSGPDNFPTVGYLNYSRTMMTNFSRKLLTSKHVFLSH